MAEDGNVWIEKFDSKDFGFWKMQIEDYIYQKKLHKPLLERKPKGMKQEAWDLLDHQALGVIRLTLARNMAFNIIKEKTTADLMKALSNMYKKPSTSNKLHMMYRLFNPKISERGCVVVHINKFNVIITQLSSVEITFDDEVQDIDSVITTRKLVCNRD